VKVYNKYYAESALVQSKNGVLRISSYKAEKLVVWVTAADLQSVSAYDNAEVGSFGDLSKIEFEIDLHNNASAKLSIDAVSASVIVNDQAKVTLSGHADEYSLKYSHAENIVENGFETMHSTKTSNTVAKLDVEKSEMDELADLF
ncbi:MAG: GIN domain-containing protein, partial [Sphingobacteriales bacterium]